MIRANKIFGAAVVAGGAWLVGCQEAPATAPTSATGVRSDVADVRPIDPVVAPAVMPAAYQPPAYESTGNTPVIAQTMTPSVGSGSSTRFASATASDDMVAPSTSTAAGGTHVVRKGETLFSIAKATYGDGKQWKKIVAANPGISASKLAVGQKLKMPS